MSLASTEAAAPSSPPRVWVRFSASTGSPFSGDSGDRITEYEIEAIRCVKGAALDELAGDQRLIRVESEQRLAAGSGHLTGVTQHVLYTDAAARRHLAEVSASPSGPNAVLIPIRKSAAWWSLAQDERLDKFQSGKGHYAIGAAYAASIFRRLYHARYLPDAEWDFLTYFEFPRERVAVFRALLAELRDPALNPEWAFVEREVEIWLSKRA